MNSSLTMERGGTWRTTIARPELAAFFGLAFVFSWYPWIIALARGTSSGAEPIPAFFTSLLGGTLIQTWLFNRTKGSVFAQMLFHAMVNTVGAGLVFPLFKGPVLVPFWYVYATLWLIAGMTAARFLSVAPLGVAAAGSAPQRTEGCRGRDPMPDHI